MTITLTPVENSAAWYAICDRCGHIRRSESLANAMEWRARHDC